MPITRLMAMASVPTKSDVRAPYSTRAQTSRPTVSVPNRWPFPGPSGPRYATTTIASGSYGVSQGAAEAAHQRRDVEAEDRHDRDERIPQRVDEVQPFGRRALRAGGADVVARDRRGDVRVHEPRVEEELHDRERRGRQDEVPDASVATQRQQPEPIAELVDQQVPEPERRERETDERRQQDRHAERRAPAACRRDS